MKKIALFSLLALFTVFVSCKKDNVDPPFQMEGMWEGKLGTGSATPSGFIGLNIKPGGVLERINANGGVSATGTWQLNGNSFTGMYTFTSGTIVNVSGTLDKGNKKLSGTWENNGDEAGTWYVTKQ